MILIRTITINGSPYDPGFSLRGQAGWTCPRAFGIVSGIFEAESQVDGGGETGPWSETATIGV